MDIRRENCIKAFEDLGMADIREYLGEYVQKGVFSTIEDGSASPADFRAALRPHLRRGTSDKEIDEAFECFLAGIPRHRLETLRRLRRNHRVYLLSNTNPIMWNGKIADEFKQEGLTIDDYFDGMVTSFEAGIMKPDEKIFTFACDKFGIKPSETLFLDDSQANLDAAAKIGFATALVPPGGEFGSILS